MHQVFILSVQGQMLSTPEAFRVRPDRQADQTAIEMALARIARDNSMHVLAAHAESHTATGNFYEATFGRPVKGTNASVPMSVVRLKIHGPGHR